VTQMDSSLFRDIAMCFAKAESAKQGA